MKIFTDASLNDTKKIAGIGCLIVVSENPENIISHNSYIKTDNIETAELLAIDSAIRCAKQLNLTSVHIVSDSVGALKKIQHIFQYPDQKRIHKIKSETQRKILFNLSELFSKMKDVPFSFTLTPGHQRKSPKFSDGYYNMLADQEASIGRLRGEFTLENQKFFHQEIGTLSTEEEKIISTQKECFITSPDKIEFHYNSNTPKAPVRIPTKRKEYYHRIKSHNSKQI